MLRVEINGDLSGPLRRFADDLDAVIVQAAGDGAQIIIGQSVTQYMRNAFGEPKRRRKDDTGPLRIVTGRLVRSLVGARTGANEPESIYRVSRGGGSVTVTFGSKVPYAAIHEYGGTAGNNAKIPGRPYLGPAINDKSGEVINLFDERLTELAKRVGL